MYEQERFAGALGLPAAAALLRRVFEEEPDWRPRLVDKRLAIYGAGNLGHMAAQYLSYLGIPLAFVVDANAKKLSADAAWSGIELYAPDDVPADVRRHTLLAVTVVKASFADIRDKLAATGWTDVIPFYDIVEAYRDRHPLSNGWFAGTLSAGERAGIAAVLDKWSDDCSRAHHLQFLAWRCLRREWVFEEFPVTTEDRYFIDPVADALTSDEVFVDCGAHCGEVAASFAALVNGNYKEICAIEADACNFRELAAAKQSAPIPRMRCLRAIVAAASGHVKFLEGLGYASQITHLGCDEAMATTLDELEVAPTFLKLHLEGGELNALKGARRTLERCRPIVATTAYHDRAGLFELAGWLMENLADYRYLLRLHGWCGTGLVVYAIPHERSTTTGLPTKSTA